MPKTVVDLLASWLWRFGCHRYGIVWKVVPHCLMHCIWRERNAQSFEDFERNLLDLKLFFFRPFVGLIGCQLIHSVRIIF